MIKACMYMALFCVLMAVETPLALALAVALGMWGLHEGFVQFKAAAVRDQQPRYTREFQG